MSPPGNLRNPPSWDDFSKRISTAPPEETETFADLCAVVFTSGSGRELLQQMRARTIEQRTAANAPEAALRELEAQRRLVFELETQRDRGLERAQQKAKQQT